MTPQTFAECAAEIAGLQANLDALVGDLLASTRQMEALVAALKQIRYRMQREAGP